MVDPRGQLIVALDAPDMKEARRLLDALAGRVEWFKIGSQLFTAEGPAIVRAVKQSGAKVFLDLKFHDIPATVARACQAAMALGVDMLNVHALGGSAMMRAAADEAARAPDGARPILIAVTVLTSMGTDDLKQVGVLGPVDARALRLAGLAKDSGLDGVVASPREAGAIKEKLGERFITVTPGVRPSWAAANDQKRIATPAEALAAGADYLVVGRPIIAAPDPLSAAERTLEEMALAAPKS